MLEPGARGRGWHAAGELARQVPAAPGRETRDQIPQIAGGWFAHTALHAYHARGAAPSEAALPSAVPVQNGLERVGRGVLRSAPALCCQGRREHGAAKPQQTCLGSVVAGGRGARSTGGGCATWSDGRHGASSAVSITAASRKRFLPAISGARDRLRRSRAPGKCFTQLVSTAFVLTQKKVHTRDMKQ